MENFNLASASSVGHFVPAWWTSIFIHLLCSSCSPHPVCALFAFCLRRAPASVSHYSPKKRTQMKRQTFLCSFRKATHGCLPDLILWLGVLQPSMEWVQNVIATCACFTANFPCAFTKATCAAKWVFNGNQTCNFSHREPFYLSHLFLMNGFQNS